MAESTGHICRAFRLCSVQERPAKYGKEIRMKSLLIRGIKLYQKYLSPLKRTRCPYIPSCSQYGLEAIQKYGAFKGGLLALWRILRCNPFSKGGVDPVP